MIGHHYNNNKKTESGVRGLQFGTTKRGVLAQEMSVFNNTQEHTLFKKKSCLG